MALDVVAVPDFSNVSRDVGMVKTGSTYIQASILVDASGNPLVSGNPLSVTLDTGLNATDDVVGLGVNAAGGASCYVNDDLRSTKQQIKGSAGKVVGWHLVNTSASRRYVKFWGLPSASVTVGSTATTFKIPLPASSGVTLWAAGGVDMASGITVAATTGIADSDTGNPTSGDVTMTVWYA